MERDEIDQALKDLGDAVETKCPISTFEWAMGIFKWTMGIFISLSVILIGALYAKQSMLSESISSIKTTLEQNKETNQNQGVLLTKISDGQAAIALAVGKISGDVTRTSRDMRDLRKRENISLDMVKSVTRDTYHYLEGQKKRK